MNDRQLRYALTVRDEGSFSRAAERLLVSQPSISDQVRLLEEELGFALFRRTGRGAEPTAQGRAFLLRADEAIAGFLGLNDLARQLRRGSESGFSIGLSSGIAQFLIPPVIAALKPVLPRTQLEVITAISPRVQRLVLQGVLDTGLTVQISPQSVLPELHRETIATIEMSLFAPPDHELARRRRAIDLAEVAPHGLIINEPSVGYGALVQSMFADRGLHPNIVAIADNVGTIKSMIRFGAGIAILPAVCALPDTQLGQLVRLPLKPRRKVSVTLIRQRHTLTDIAEHCIARLSSSLRTELSQSAAEAASA